MWPAAVLAALSIAAIYAAKLDAPALVRALLAGPIYYLLPVGVGLLLTQPFASLTRSQRFLVAYLVGLAAICAFFVARERAQPAAALADLLAFALLLVAVTGFVVARRLFTFDLVARSAAIEIALVLPVFGIGYVLWFGLLSEYPLSDLFQATHVLKAAEDFGRFDNINPFTADSYVPALSVIEGLMIRYFGFDPIGGVWVVAALSTVPKLLALRTVMHSLLEEREARLFATAAAACFVAPLSPTNGDLVTLGSLATLSLLLHGCSIGAPMRMAGVALGCLGALVIGYLAARSTPITYLVVLASACVLPLAVRRFRVDPLLAAGALVIALAPIHRSASLFVPMVCACAILLLSIRRLPQMDQRWLPVSALTLSAIAALAITALLGFILANEQHDLRELAPSRWLTETILQSTLGGNLEILSGSGPKVALFELARAMSPAFVALAGICTSVAWRRTHSGMARDALSAWLIAVALACIALLGLPFLYRIGFLVIALLAVGLAAGRFAAAREVHTLDRSILLAVVVYLAIALIAVFGCMTGIYCDKPNYVALAGPLIAGLAFAALMAAIYGLTLPANEGRRLRAIASVVLVLMFSFEMVVNRTYFMPYSHGPLDHASRRAVTHLSPNEIELARLIRAIGRRVILISDPFTMANLRALTGLNSIVTFSNLDTMSGQSVHQLRSWLRETMVSGKGGQTCGSHPAFSILESSPTSSAELNYWLARLWKPKWKGSDVLAFFGYSDAFLLKANPIQLQQFRLLEQEGSLGHGWRRAAIAQVAAGASRASSESAVEPWARAPMFLLVVNQKTLDWAFNDKPVSYFPDVRPLDKEFLADLARRCDVRVHDGRFALVRFPFAP